MSQNSRQSVDPRSTGRHSEGVNGFVRRTGPGEPPKTSLPSSPTFGTSVGLGVNTDSTRPRLGPVSSKRRGPNQKGPEGLETPRARKKKLEGPAAVEPRARPRIGAQPARPLRDVNGDPPGHRCVSTSSRVRVAERKQIGSASPGSGGAFRPMGPALIPSRRRDYEQNPAARRHIFIGLVKPPAAGTAGQPYRQDSKEGRKSCSPSQSMRGARNSLRAPAQRLQVRYLGITSHVMCHSRPNIDRTLHCRTIEEFQKRNRWLVSTSLRH